MTPSDQEEVAMIELSTCIECGETFVFTYAYAEFDDGDMTKPTTPNGASLKGLGPRRVRVQRVARD